jgi:hypothetical protein
MTTTEASPVIAPAVKPAGAASSRLPVQPLWIASAFQAQQARLGRRSTYGAAGGLAPVVPHRVTGYDADWLAIPSPCICCNSRALSADNVHYVK